MSLLLPVRNDTSEPPPPMTPARRRRLTGHLSLAFLLDQVAAGVAGLGSRDALLVLAINQANIAPLTRDPTARQRYGALDAPAPDDERRPVSVSGVAASLGLPYETVRRRVRALEAKGVCRTVGEGVIVPQQFLASEAYLASVIGAHQRLRDFYEALSSHGLLDPLPAPAYPPEEALRGAVRLLSDYILRSAEHLLVLTGDITSAVVLLGVTSHRTDLRPLLAGEAAPRRRPISTAALAQRLGLPAETVRRRITGLVEEAACVRVTGGFLTPEETFAEPAWDSFFADNATNVQRLFSGLAERGLVAAWTS